MKTLIKKSLLVLMVVFIAVFTLGVSSKVKAAEESATITFDSTSKRTVFNTSQQVWVENGITVTNDKGSSSSNVANYSNPARFYKSSKLTIAYSENISKIVFDCNSTSYATAMKNSISASLGSVSVSSDKVTLTLTTPANSVVISTLSGGQVRMDGITVYYELAEGTPSISISGGLYTEVNDVVSLTVELENLTGNVTWASSNTDVATVDQDGNVTAISMGKTTITANVDGVEDSIEFIVYPTDGSELSIADAIKVCQYTGTDNCPFVYSTTGVIKSIDTAYDSGYGNITVTITDGTDSIKVFRLKGGSDLEVGDKITVTGVLVNYYGNTPEFVAGCTYELDPTTAIQKSVNKVNAYMSFAYKYTREDVEKTDETTGEVTIENLFTDVDFRIKCGVDKALADIEGVESYGIKVFTADKEMELVATGNDETCLFAVISLGDALTNAERLNVVFTVQAYIVVDGVTYTSKLTKSYSIAQMVEAYYNNAETSDKVVTLYELIQNL